MIFCVEKKSLLTLFFFFTILFTKAIRVCSRGYAVWWLAEQSLTLINTKHPWLINKKQSCVMDSHLEISEHTTAAHKEDEHSIQVQWFHCCSAMGCSWFLLWHFPLSGTAVCSSLKSCTTPNSSPAVWWRDPVQLASLINAGPWKELEALSREVICKCRLAECVSVPGSQFHPHSYYSS